jgi:iron complex transport system ATP-binding protein
MTPVLEGIGLSVGRGKERILAGIDLAVKAGERIGLLGENGSGKTTLLRVLAGLDRPLSGEVRWEGRPLPRGAGRVETLGVLFQTEAPSHFTVRELVTLGLGLDGPPGDSARRLVDQALDRAELGALADRSCAALSGGEAQRAALARALVAGPRLLLLDEPTNHLDPARQAALLIGLEGLRGSVAVVLATHDLELAASCDRVAVLHRGRMAVLGAPTEVLTPENLARTLGVLVRRLDDPDGGPPLFRIVAPSERGVAA